MSGIPIGYKGSDGNFYVYNHHNLTIQYHQPENNELYRIVGFNVQAFS